MSQGLNGNRKSIKGAFGRKDPGITYLPLYNTTFAYYYFQREEGKQAPIKINF